MPHDNRATIDLLLTQPVPDAIDDVLMRGNDVVLAMCSGALRAYLLELDALPDVGLVAMVPVGLNAKQSHLASCSMKSVGGFAAWSPAAPRAYPTH